VLIHERDQVVDRRRIDQRVTVEQHHVAASTRGDGLIARAREPHVRDITDEPRPGELPPDDLDAVVGRGVVDDDDLDVPAGGRDPERGQALGQEAGRVPGDDGDGQVDRDGGRCSISHR
jgi:hypothetical protein